jgi:hypothetical protein
VRVSNPIVGGNIVVASIKHRLRREHEFAMHRRLTLRMIFCSEAVFFASCEIVLVFVYSDTSFSVENAAPRAA